jgi:hypothetical protein
MQWLLDVRKAAIAAGIDREHCKRAIAWLYGVRGLPRERPCSRSDGVVDGHEARMSEHCAINWPLAPKEGHMIRSRDNGASFKFRAHTPVIICAESKEMLLQAAVSSSQYGPALSSAQAVTLLLGNACIV